MPENEDMVNWILDGQKEGNAVAFATAQLWLRATGYPARYTEGYHLSDMDAQATSDAGEKEVILTTKMHMPGQRFILQVLAGCR